MKKTIDAEAALQEVINGKTYAEIAQGLNVSTTLLRERLDALSDSAHARARTSSAEAWLDRGLEPLQQALDKGSNIDSSAARAYAQECARRAALRNPAYRDKQDHSVTGDLTLKIIIDDAQDKPE